MTDRQTDRQRHRKTNRQTDRQYVFIDLLDNLREYSIAFKEFVSSLRGNNLCILTNKYYKLDLLLFVMLCNCAIVMVLNKVTIYSLKLSLLGLIYL